MAITIYSSIILDLESDWTTWQSSGQTWTVSQLSSTTVGSGSAGGSKSWRWQETVNPSANASYGMAYQVGGPYKRLLVSCCISNPDSYPGGSTSYMGAYGPYISNVKMSAGVQSMSGKHFLYHGFQNISTAT
jgi:hypothetical protein